MGRLMMLLSIITSSVVALSLVKLNASQKVGLPGFAYKYLNYEDVADKLSKFWNEVKDSLDSLTTRSVEDATIVNAEDSEEGSGGEYVKEKLTAEPGTNNVPNVPEKISKETGGDYHTGSTENGLDINENDIKSNEEKKDSKLKFKDSEIKKETLQASDNSYEDGNLKNKPESTGDDKEKVVTVSSSENVQNKPALDKSKQEEKNPVGKSETGSGKTLDKKVEVKSKTPGNVEKVQSTESQKPETNKVVSKTVVNGNVNPGVGDNKVKENAEKKVQNPPPVANNVKQDFKYVHKETKSAADKLGVYISKLDKSLEDSYKVLKASNTASSTLKKYQDILNAVKSTKCAVANNDNDYLKETVGKIDQTFKNCLNSFTKTGKEELLKDVIVSLRKIQEVETVLQSTTGACTDPQSASCKETKKLALGTLESVTSPNQLKKYQDLTSNAVLESQKSFESCIVEGVKPRSNELQNKIKRVNDCRAKSEL